MTSWSQLLPSSPCRERAIVRRAAKRAGAVEHASQTASGHALGQYSTRDGWQASRFLLALAEEDAAREGMAHLAMGVTRSPTDGVSAACRVQDFVRDSVRFERQASEVFAGPAYVLEKGSGDCDQQARIAYALLRAAGVPVRLAFLHKPGEDPSHVAVQALADGAWRWLETTLPARLGEHPYAAATRAGVLDARDDLATEVRTMSASELPPAPEDFGDTDDAEQLARDVAALERRGFLNGAMWIGQRVATDPDFRRAVWNFQANSGLVADGLIGPATREALGTLPERPDLGAITPRLTAHLDDDFFRGVVAMTDRLNAKGAHLTPDMLLAVWLVESGVNPRAYNVSGAHGLNQLMQDEVGKNASLKGTGWKGSGSTVPTRVQTSVGVQTLPAYRAEYLNLSATQQLPWVERFYASQKYVGKANSRAMVYLLTFLPALAGGDTSMSRVLARKNGPGLEPRWYAANPLFHHGKDYIALSDLDQAITDAQRNRAPYWAELMARLRAVGWTPPPPTSSGPPIVGLLVLGACGLLANHLLA